MIRKLAPNFNFMDSFRGEISRLTTQHFSPARIQTNTMRLARDVERLIMDAPSDTRRVLRRFAEGDLGRLPGLEALGSRFSRNLERLARAVMFAALVISGAMLMLTPMGGRHHVLGEAMIVSGIIGMIFAAIAALRRDHGKDG